MELNLKFLRNEIIGNDTFFNTPFGKRLITYADYTASGKTLLFIEKYLIEIQKYYANTHTDDSFTGKTMTSLLHKAEQNIKLFLNANDNNYIISVATGTTGAIAKLCEILGLYLNPGLKYNLDKLLLNYRYDQEIIKDIFKNMSETKPVVFVGPYEHHSNYLIWKESFAEVVEINLDNTGGIDIKDLKQKLKDPKYQQRVKIGSFSAASNVTGIKTDLYKIAKIMHNHNGLIFYDFAASGPYVDININKESDSYFDAVYLSPHKFIGGPATCGILVINKSIYANILSPTVAGGGTVDFVSSYCYEFTKDVETREKAGTPGILQIIKASLVLELKSLIGVSKIHQIEQFYINKVINRFIKNPNIEILGPIDPSRRLSILSFNIKHNNKYLHHKFVATLLNDLFGIQSRAGCACAGPYGHRLMGVDKEKSKKFQEVINEGYFSLKPGFVRVNFHYLITESEVEFICRAIEFIANYGYLFLSLYKLNLKTGGWKHNYFTDSNSIVDSFGILDSFKIFNKDVFKKKFVNKDNEYNNYFNQATIIAQSLESNFQNSYQVFKNSKYELLRWFNFIYLEK